MRDRPLDLVSFGEAMVRLTPPSFQRLEQARSLDVHVGGAELNVAVAAARLGLATGWVSRLTNNALGRLVASRAREHGVDLSSLLWTDDDRIGLYFVELGASPRPTGVTYDRAGSALSRITTGSIDWPRAFDGARWFHVSGITPALSDTAADVTTEALRAARSAGLKVSYDLNYRSKLWTPEQARARQTPLMQYVDVLITTEEDTRVVFGIDSGRDAYRSIDAASYAVVAERLQDQFGFEAVAITLRENPRVWVNTWSAIVRAGGVTHEAARYEVEIVDRIGAGDAFSAGFIFGALEIGGWEAAVRYGTALSALKHTMPGDFGVSTRQEVEQVLAGGSLRVAR